MSISHEQMLAVIEADRRKLPIEWKPYRSSLWLDCECPVPFNFAHHSYRVKPVSPKPREFRVYLWNGVEPTTICGEGDYRIPGIEQEVTLHPGAAEFILVREVLPETK